MKRGRFHRFFPAPEDLRAKKRVLAVYLILRLVVMLVMVEQFFKGNYENVFMCVLTLTLFLLPSFFDRTLRIHMPDTLEIIILLFIFAAEILGEINAYYVKYPLWDKALHTINGFLCAAIGFSMVDLLNRTEKLHFSLSPLFVAMVAFCFSMTIGVLWEFIEFSIDRLFMMDMQKDTIVRAFGSVLLDPTNTNTVVRIKDIESVVINGTPLPFAGYIDIGLIDTMQDLLVNFLGAGVFSVFGYFYRSGKISGKFLKRLLLTPEVPAAPAQERDAEKP